MITMTEKDYEVLDEKLRTIREHLNTNPEISVTYFQPDERKSGGQYVTVVGNVRKVDEYEQCLLLNDGTRIVIEDILELVLN